MDKYIQLPLDFEVWKPIPEYEGLYEVSNYGRVRRLAGSPKCNKTRILNPPLSAYGYRFIFLWKKGIEDSFYVHRLVLAAFIGPRPDGLEVNHKNGNKSDNRLENLEYVTRHQNEMHSLYVLGNITKIRHGEMHKDAKLTETKVREIRAQIGKVGVRELGRRYGVDQRVIRDIRDRKTWKHVK